MKNYINTVKKSYEWSDKKKSLYIPLAFIKALGYDINDFNQVEMDFTFDEYKYDFCIHTESLVVFINFDKDNTVVPRASHLNDKGIVVLSVKGLDIRAAYRAISMREAINVENEPDALVFLNNTDEGRSILKKLIETSEKDNQIIVDVINSLKKYELPDNIMVALGVEDKAEFNKKFSRAFTHTISVINDTDKSDGDELEKLREELQMKDAKINELEIRISKIPEDWHSLLEEANKSKNDALLNLEEAHIQINSLKEQITELENYKEMTEAKFNTVQREESDLVSADMDKENTDMEAEEDPFINDDGDSFTDDDGDPFTDDGADPFADEDGADPFADDDADPFADDGGDLFGDESTVVHRTESDLEIPNINKFDTDEAEDPFAD